ncbi:hypothetical protein NIES267_41410 [Calothrix parasitica NIES-267]|uniref:VWFA domain-containing protein n=1 Tax=Calothrix parasitica NIES-267 TaxID=1973488 RepID=A0A1Z4LTS4_9CYAN|nr:hypothetical protein NIES267_41410 [Calothrix parasitica NIES-267]
MPSYRFANLTFLGVLLIASLTVSGCSNSSNASTDAKYAESLEMYKEAKSTTEKISVTQNRVFMAVDNSGSMQTARTDAPKISHVLPALDSLSRTGGNFGMSTICSQSNKPLLRVTLSAPPSLSKDISNRLDELSNDDTKAEEEAEEKPRKNPFKVKKKKKEFKEKMPKVLEEIRELEKQFEENYKKNRALVKGFQPKLKKILNQPRSCKFTDIKSSINRANLFLNEPNTSETNNIRKFAVFITDGQHEVEPKNSKQATKIQIKKEHVFLVNGSSDIGIFSSIPHKRFEAPSPAFKVLVDLMSKKEDMEKQQSERKNK